MDLNTSVRSPLSLSKLFYDDITKDIPSPVTKDFYDAVSKPVEEKPAPVAPARYELASPREIAETVGAVGEAVIRTPLQIAGAAASAIRGGSREAMADKNSFLTRIINAANKDAEDLQKKYADNKVVIAPLSKLGLPDDITTGTITRFPQQAAFSAVSAGAGLVAGLGTAAVSGPAAPIAGRAAGMAASGGVAYRMQKDNSTKDLYEKLNATSVKTTGRELSPEEWKTAYDKNEGSLVEQGISEAIPEAIGNLVGFELFFGAAKNVFGKQLAKTTIGKTLEKYGAAAAGKMLAEQATEQTTETWTQQWQHNIDVEMGLKPGETKRSWSNFDDLRQSNKEVFADILFLSTVMGGAALAGEHVKEKMDTKASVQLVKDVVAENKFDSIPNEFLPAIYEYAQELFDKQPTDKSLVSVKDAFAKEMDKRGIDFDMTSKFKEYFKIDAAMKADEATGEDVARWASLRDEFKEKNISPDLYTQYLSYQNDVNKAYGLTKLIANGKVTEEQRKEFNRLVDVISSKATILGLPKDTLESSGVEKGGVVKKPVELPKSEARDILLGNEPTAKRKNLTAKDILTEGDVDIQSEGDLTPENLAAIDKKLEIAGTGGKRSSPTSAGEAPIADDQAKMLDITDEFDKLLEKGLGRKRPSDISTDVPKEENIVHGIASGNMVEDFKFPEHYSPGDLNGLWDDLYTASEDIAAKNKPTIDALTQELNTLKRDRSQEAVARKKQINVEIDRLNVESQIVTHNAEIAWQNAQEDLAQKVVAKLKEEGIEADPDTVYDAISTLADGRMNEQGWGKPILQQVIDYVKEEAPATTYYHGTAKEFDQYDPAYQGKGVGWNDQGNALYLTEDEPTGKMFANVARQNMHFKDSSLSPMEQIDKVNKVTGGEETGVVKTAKLQSGTKVLEVETASIPKTAAIDILKKAGLENRKTQAGTTFLDNAADEFKKDVPVKKVLDWMQYADEKINPVEFVTKELGYDAARFQDERMKTWDYWRDEFGQFPESLPYTVAVYNHEKVIFDKAATTQPVKPLPVTDAASGGDEKGEVQPDASLQESSDEEVNRSIGKNPKDFSKGDIVKFIGGERHDGRLYEIVEPDKGGMAKLKDLSTGETRDYNAYNNPYFEKQEHHHDLSQNTGQGEKGARKKSTVDLTDGRPAVLEKTGKEGNKSEEGVITLPATELRAIGEKTYSAQSLSEKGAIKGVVTLNGKNYTTVGGVQGLESTAYEVIPIGEYKGVTNKYGESPGHGYEGVKAKFRGKEYVLANKITLRRSLPTNEEAIQELKEAYEQGGYWASKYANFADAVRGQTEHVRTVADAHSNNSFIKQYNNRLAEAYEAYPEIETPTPDLSNNTGKGEKGSRKAAAAKNKKEETPQSNGKDEIVEPTASQSTESENTVDKRDVSRKEDEKAKAVKKYLLEHIDEAIKARKDFDNNQTEESGGAHVIIDVPMDGKFVVINRVENLEKFKKNVAKLKVTNELNKLPQHSDKRTGKSTDQISKESEEDVANYWAKRSEFKDRYGRIPAAVEAAQARLESYNEIKRKVDAKEITLKQLGEDAKAASKEENTGPDIWRDSWFGKTPTYRDLMERIKSVEKEIRDLEASKPEIEASIKKYYPGLAKEMFGEKAEEKASDTTPEKAPEEIKAAGTGGKRGPAEGKKAEESTGDVGAWKLTSIPGAIATSWRKDGTKRDIIELDDKYRVEDNQMDLNVSFDNFKDAAEYADNWVYQELGEEETSAPGDEQAEISARLRAQNEQEAEFEYRKKHDNLLKASDADKTSAVEGFSQEDAQRFLSDLDAAPGDDPKARQSILDKYPELSNQETAKADILKEISEISDEELDLLLDAPAEETKEKTRPPETAEDAVKKAIADRDRGFKLPSAKPAKSIDDILADIAKDGVAGADEALKGLYELFGGSSLKSFPGGFDKDTYAKAKPHFEAALDHFIEIGKGLREFAAAIVQQFGDAIRPYLKRFIQEKRDEVAEEDGGVINLDENTGKGEGGARSRRKLTDQEKAEREAKKAAADEKKAHKAAMGEFKNVGYVYDPEKLNQKIKDKSPKSAAKIILDEMVPGKIWAIDYPEGATPGVNRLVGLVQKYPMTFKEYLVESRDRLRYISGSTIEDKIERWMDPNRGYSGTIDQLKSWAHDYAKIMEPMVAAFQGQSSITNIIGRLQDAILAGARREDGGFLLYNDRPRSLSVFVDNRDFVKRPQSFYDFLTDSWQRLLEDENEILLSEIDINKRGRNKAVVRSGLPDHRNDIELKKTEDFQAPFGFNGVGFGEEGWINQEERNRVIPAAYDAFKDLAATIGAPDIGMSLGRQLAVQFANLGHKAKGAAAAYFPSVRTINFTRDNGDGTMAHEWGHGLQDLAATDAANEIEKVIQTFFHVYDFDAGTRLVDDLLAKDSMFLKRMVSNKKQNRIDAVKAQVTDLFENAVRKETDYYSTAQQMDPDYTARSHEMWARAFEAYIYDTLQGKNNYLVNDFVAAGRVGGKAGVGARLVYPAGKERETFNVTIKRFLDGLVWNELGKPSLKDGYVSIEKANELMLQLQLGYLLDQVEARYMAIWASEPSKDGYYWYRYDDTSFGPMMQPDGYGGYDKGYTSEGQNGEGAVAYLTQLHPDDILDYKLSGIQYEGENPIYISKERGGINDSLSEDGTEALEEVSSKPDRSPDEGGDVRSGDRGSGDSGLPGTREHGKQRGADGSSEGDSVEGVHPPPAGNYRITDLTLNDPKSVGVRFGLNLSAVKVLNLVESENRNPTDAEKDILVQYSGWGGMSELFAYDPTDTWKGKAELLKAELNEQQIRDAASSSTSAYYTPVPVGTFMWKLAQRLGFERGVVLDPATGANGLFLGTMPLDLAKGTALQGIEMDGVSARIAEQLYGLASIETKAFQDVKKPNNRFDLTITNVPFENFSPSDLKHNKGGYRLHNYFINKMINLTAPGALSMIITTSNTLDAVGAHLTEFAGKAQLVGAIRLPSGIYSATQVATDILVFRKNIEGGKFVGVPAEEWTTAGTDESTGLTINNYFLKHPEMVAGKLEKITGRYGNESLRVVGEGDLQSNLERLAASFPDKIVEREAVKEAKSIDDIISAPGTIKEGGLYINDKDEVCVKENGEEIKLPIATASEQKKAAISRGYVHLLDQVRTVLRAQKTETDDAVVKAEQAKLKKFYDHFVKKFGPINDPKNHDVYVDYTDSAWVLALEEYDPDKGKVTKIADIFTKNITGMASRPDRADTDHDALAMALDEFGYPNLEYMARLRNSDVASVMEGVGDKIIENPETGFLETMDEYLSGNVKRKLAVARDMVQSNPEYARNISLLEAAQPPEIPQHRITARIGASWISPAHLSEFVRDKMGLMNGLRAVFNFSPVSNEWSMSFHGEESYRGHGKGFSENKAEVQRQIAAAKRSVEATTVWGTQRMDFFELMKCALQGKRPQVTFTVDRKQYLDEVATQAAEVKLQDIQIEFGRWLFADTFREDQAVKRFNDIINTSVPMNADGSHLTFPGKSMWMVTPKEKESLGVGDALVFYPHQMNATWKYLKSGNLYLGHEVGTGKTVTMALIAMEAKRIRGKKKVLYVTLNDSTMGQAVAEIKNLYPMANVLPVRVSTNEQRKQRSLQKIALNDFDVAIMRQQDLDRIGLSPESEKVFIEEEILELREILEEAKRDGARILEQDIQVQLHALEEKLKAPRAYDEAKKKNLFFDDLGIDLMIVDEAHKYKNIPYATRLTRITGLNPAGSPTAKDFFRKTQYLNAQFPKKDAIVLASGTALSNSIAEMYNIQRMLQPQEVKRQGVWSFDRWIANHGDMGAQLEWDGARGQYKVITTNRRIVNAGRLLATAYQNVDSVRAKDTPVRRPIIRGGEPQRVKVQPNQYVEDYKQIILERCAALEADPKNAEYEGVPDNMLRIISNMSSVAIDQRLLHGKDAAGKSIPGPYANTELQQDSKIAVASKIIYRRWTEEARHKGVQLLFADMGTPPGTTSKAFKYKTEEQVSELDSEQLAEYNQQMLEADNASSVGLFNTYEAMKKELITLGIPPREIAFIHDADHSNKEKKASNLRTLFKKVNAGDIRVLIGSTSKAGTGVNIQGRVSDIHHLDVWWNFSAWEQRNGRGIRAGNLYANESMPGTYIWNYVTETTVDATRWDKVFAKGKVLNAVLGGDINLDVIEDISDETMSAKMMAAEASGDPLMSTQATLLQQVQGLRFEQAAHLDVVRRSKMDLAAIPGRVQALEKCIKEYQHSRDIMDKVTAVRFIGDDRTLILLKHGKEIAEALEKAVMADTGSWTENKKATLLVFGSHTETEVVEKVAGEEGEQKEKKVKKYAFAPFPAKADITGKSADPYGRRLLISGDIISSDRNLADIKIDKAKKATVEVKANVSRTVTEFLSFLTGSEKSTKETIAELKSNEPKLQKVIETPWAKVGDLATKDKELRQVEAQMAARGVSVGDPITGISIDKYKGIVPVLEDVADKDEWSIYNGIVYPHQNTMIGVRGQPDLSRFLKSGKLKPNIATSYSAPDSLNVLEGGKPSTPATEPVAYTVIENETRFWVPAGVTFVTVDPVQWNLLQRIIGKEGAWHYESRAMYERYLVHVNAKGERDAFIWAKQESYIPQGVRDISDKSIKSGIPPAGKEQYSVGKESGTGRGAMDLEIVQSLFPNQQVVQDGDNFTVTLKNGARATIYGVAEIIPNAVSLNAGYKKGLATGQFIAGAFDGLDAQGRGVIRIVRDNAKAPWTVSHESVHWLEKLGVISEMDKATLNTRIQKEGKWNKDISHEENRATWLANFAKGPQPNQTVLAQIWQKIQDFISRVVGIRTAGMIGRELQSGKIFEREIQDASLGGEAYGTGKYDNFGDSAVTDFSEDEAWHDIAYREPTKKAIARLNAWLKDNRYATIRMYHGTDASIPVMKEGLKPTSARTAKSLQSSHGTVSLSLFPGMAHQFGRLAYAGKEIAIYPVDVLVKNLVPDNDQLRNKRHFGGRTDIGDTLAESIAIGHGAKVRGAVPVDWIRAGEEKPSVKAYDEALSAHAYISPRQKRSLSAQEKTVRNNAYGVKGMDPIVLDSVAKEMAALIPKEARKSAILVPIPGHTGETEANVALAERIAEITGSRMADVLKRRAGQSQRDARVAGRRTMKPAELGMVSTETLDGRDVFFVDNVISSGATIRAARDAVGGGKGLVYAKSNPKGEKYTIATADMGLPKWLGDKVKQAFKKDAVASILQNSGPIQSGPLDGGCRVLARALKRIEPTGKIITIEGQLEDGTWQAEHYGLELDGGMIDGDGYAPSRESWARRFAKNESLDRPYRITEGEVQSEDIPQDAPTEKKLAAALEKELAPDEGYGESRAEKGIAVYEHLPVFAITEKGLTRRSRRANNNQEVSNGHEVSGTAVVRADNAPAAGQGIDDKRKIPAPGGRVLPYVPERGTLPAVKSEPIGIWKSSRRKITSLEDAAVIARDNLFRDAQEVFVTIVTDKSGKILAVNQHATGAPNQSQVYAYFAAGQILNVEGASKVWTVHNHPSGQAKLSEADLSVSSNIGDLIVDAGIESMPIIAITPTRYSDNTWSSEPLPPKEPALYELPLLGRKFDQSPEGLESIGSQKEFEEFGRLYMKEGGMILVSAQRQPVALIAIDDYSKLRPLHTEILREAEKRNAVDFMIYNADKTLTTADIDNLLSFAKNTQLEFTTVRDSAGDHYEKIKELWGAVRNSRERKVFYSVAKKETDAIDSTSIFPEVNERLKAAKGVKYASLKDRTKDALVTGWEHFTRHFQHLEPETDGAVIDVFRKFQDVPAWAKDETVRQLSGFIGRLSPPGRDVFTMNILLPDMIRDIENGTLAVDDEGELPFGYKNRDQVQQDYDHFRAIAEGNTAIMEALDRRNAFMTSLTDQLIQHKLLKKELANDPAAYIHHQVLAYMNYKENPNWGMSSRDVRTHRKGWQLGRKGSQLDYNTEYVESEFEIISQALTQIETVKSLKEIERLADIKPDLEAEAKDQNMATFTRKAFTNPLDDPLLPFRTKIAMGFQKLAKLFTTENDMYALPMEFDDVIEHIVDQEEQRRAAAADEIEFDPVPHPRMFALLNYLINHEGPGSMPAAMIFKAIAARNAFIKEVVGKDWVTYHDLIPEGYVAHKPETGSTFYFTNSIADQALSQVMAGHKNLPDAVRQVLARGRDEEWVVKEGISKTLNEFRPAMSDSLPAKMSKDMLTTWKQWILMNPFRVIKYNINNMSGDLDIAMAYDPKIITGYFTQAFKDLWAASRGNASETLMDELSELTKRGVVGSGMTAMDIPELGDVKSVKGLVDFFDGKSKGVLSKWWTMSKKLSTLRENILRLAAHRYFLDRLEKGDNVYGASRKEEVDAIASREDKAAKLARELIGDYGNISHAGQYIRERMIPFYSWLEINAPRYVRLFRNLKHEGAGIGALGGVLAWKTTKLAIKASAIMGLVILWNAAFFPHEEDELQETGREQLHMILGRRADGSIITIRFQGALTDALSWFGMGNPVEQARKVVSETKSVGGLAKDIATAAPLKLFQGFRPEPKLLYETLSGQSFFPDPMHPRPIRDTTEHILRTFSLDRIYNQVSGKPKQGGTWASQMYRDIQSLAFNEADPGEQAYYTSRKYIFDWLDKQGKEKPAAMPTNRSNSLYYYKQALKFGDFDAAEKYLKKYQDLGGKLHDVQGSIRRVHPLASLRLADRYKFKASLSPEQQETLSMATTWYKRHYVDNYREQRMRVVQ